MNPVVLFGATGYTGRLIASRFVRSGIPFTAVGRDPEKLEKLVSAYKTRVPFKVADASDPASVEKVLVRGTKVLVNCAGPFIDMGEAVVEAALKRKVNYLDTCGELFFIKRAHERFHEAAVKARRTVVPAMAFEYALGDFGADRLLEKLGGAADMMEIFYYIPTFNPSDGTKRSMMRAMTVPVYGYEGGGIVEIKAGTFRKNLHVKGQTRPLSALSFPGGEVFTVPQHAKVTALRDYMVMSVSTARLLYGNRPSVLRASSKARAAEEEADAATDGPTKAQREKNRFQLILEGTAGGKQKALVLKGKDVYGLTSALIAFGVRQILNGKVKGTGVLSPAQAFEAPAFWSAVKRANVSSAFGNAALSS